MKLKLSTFAFLSFLTILLENFSIANAAVLSGFSGDDAPNIGLGSTTINFENQSIASFPTLTIKTVEFVGVDTNLTTTNLTNDNNQFNAFSHNARGQWYLDNQSGSPSFQQIASEIKFNFNFPTKAFAFNFGVLDNIWRLEAFNALGVSLGSVDISPNRSSNDGDYIGLNLTDYIKYATLTNTDVSLDWIYIDNFVFLSYQSIEDTQASLAQSVLSLRGAYALQNARIHNNLNNDCNLFNKYGICTSLSGGQNHMSGQSGSDATSGTLTVAFKMNDNIRVGAYLDQNLHISNAGGISYSNYSPGVGAFAVWNANPNGLGAQLKVSAAYADRDMSITRQVVGLSEPGMGKTNLTSYGISLVGSYGMVLPEDINFTPYLGLRYTNDQSKAYTEEASDNVTTPLSYGAVEQKASTAIAGLKFAKSISFNSAAYVSFGLEHDLNRISGTYAATGLDGLLPISFSSDIKHTRSTVSLGAHYDLSDSQRIAANLAWAEQAFSSEKSTSLMMTYTAGF